VEQLGIDGRWFISQLVNFIVLLLILQRFLYKPMLNMLHQREERIRASMDDAERVKKAAAQAEEAYKERIEESRREAQTIIAQAVQQAERVREERMALAEEEARQVVAKAKEDAQHERQRVVAELRSEVADLAVLAAGRVLGKALDAKTHRQVVLDFLDESGKLN
jgi:F-type H+-transporting ATPase subunit b